MTATLQSGIAWENDVITVTIVCEACGWEIGLDEKDSIIVARAHMLAHTGD